MKKFIKTSIFLLVMTIALFNDNNVYANDCDNYACAKCIYEDEYAKYIYDIVATSKGKLNIVFSSKENRNEINEITAINIINEITGDSFFTDTSTNKIKCPTIYQDIKEVAGQADIKLTTNDGNPLEATSESNNNNKTITDASHGGGGSRHDTNYTCTYKGQISGKTLKITKTSTEPAWTIEYPDGTSEQLDSTKVGSNVMPTGSCQDIFYLNDARDKVRMVDANSKYAKNYIANYCNRYKEVEQFCSGECKVENALCGADDGNADSGNCPKELRPIIVFIKKVAVNSLQFIIPILLIIMGSIDMTKAVMSNDEKNMKDATSKLIRRIIAAVLFFFVTTIVTIVIGRIAEAGLDDTNSWQSCWFDID